jgi:hypothetical protein
MARILQIYLMYSMAFSVGWGPQICDWAGLHLASLHEEFHYYLTKRIRAYIRVKW